MAKPKKDRLLSLKQYEYELGLTYTYLYSLIRRKVINYVQDGKKVMIWESDLMKYLEANKVEKFQIDEDKKGKDRLHA